MEIADTITRLGAMHGFLEASLRCACVGAEDCALLAEADEGAAGRLARRRA